MMMEPEFMRTKEWGEFEDKASDDWLGLKPGAPEWLVKAVEEYRLEADSEVIHNDPAFMDTKEWEEWSTIDPETRRKYLKPGAPEWLVKAVEEYERS